MGGRVRPLEELDYVTCETALDDDGYILSRTNALTEGNVALTSPNDVKVVGINYKSTQDLFNLGSYLTNQSVPYVDEGQVYVKLAANNSEIEVGDDLAAVNNGYCDKATAVTTIATYMYRIGVAKEAKDASAGGKILVKLKIYGA